MVYPIQYTKIVDEESRLGKLLMAPFGFFMFCMVGLLFTAIKESQTVLSVYIWTNGNNV